MRCLQYLAKFTDFPCPNHAPSREFVQDQDAIRAIAAGISRTGKPEVIRLHLGKMDAAPAQRGNEVSGVKVLEPLGTAQNRLAESRSDV